MDPATAIGVASAAISFASFSAKLLSTAHTIYKARNIRRDEDTTKMSDEERREMLDQQRRARQELSDREKRALSDLDDFDQLAQNAQTTLKECSDNQESGSDVGHVLGDVDSICREFEDLIRRLATRDEQGRKSVIRSLGTAASILRENSKVNEMRERLDQMQARTVRFTLLAIWGEAQKSSQRELKFAQSLDQMLESLQRIERHAGINEITDDEVMDTSDANKAKQYVGQLEDKVVRELEKEDEIYETVIKSLFQPDLRPSPEVWRSDVSRVREDVFHSGVLSSLVSEFPTEINRREAAISEPYRDTFSWIFEEKPQGTRERHGSLSLDFPAWLESDSKSPFWITGKPGSGKSTLMKFIIHAPELEKHLKKWAGDFPLQITSFYAWIAGTKLQNSTSGFMRTILYQCIKSSSPHLAMESNLAFAVAPRRWALFATLRNGNKQPLWEDWELKESFDLLLTEIVNTKRALFFVDGLDEFELLPTETLDIIRGLCMRDGIKVCVASRPWVEFNDALDSFPMLRMQDLTADDMKKFVEGSFNNNRGFKEQKQVFPEKVDALVKEVVDKANGVFLWSRIVVKNLLTGFTQGDNLPRLAEILRGLPEDVDDLYTRIWRGIDARKSDFARLVALRRAAFEAPTYLTLWLADGGHSQSLDIRNIPNDRLHNLRLQMVRRLDSATRGILELSPTNTVDFLHRTTMDWVAQDEVWEEISSHLDSKFNPNLSLLQAEALAYIGLLLRAFDNQEKLHVTPGSQVLRYAHRVGDSTADKAIAVEVLETFEKGLGAYEKELRAYAKELRADKKWLRGAGLAGRNNGCSNFFDLMCCFCALPYLEAKLSKTKPNLMKWSSGRGDACSLELAAFGERSSSVGQDWIPLDTRRATVELLLDRGAPAKMREMVRLKVQYRQINAEGDHRRYWDDILALLAAEDEKRWNMSRLVARVLRDKTR